MRSLMVPGGGKQSRMRLATLWLFLAACVWQISSALQQDRPYEQIGQFISRFGKNTKLDSYPVEEITCALSTLARSQSALKSMDGITHQFRNVMKESSSLSSRFTKLVKSKRKRMKEAAKVYEYTRSVERGMQAAEIIQTCAMIDANARQKFLNDVNLTEIKRIRVSEGNLKVAVSVLRPHPLPLTNAQNTTDVSSTSRTTAGMRRSKAEVARERMLMSIPVSYAPGEVIIVITEEAKKDSLNVAQILRLMNKEDTTRIIRATDNDLMGSSEGSRITKAIAVQRSFLRLAVKSLEGIVDVLNSSVSTHRESFSYSSTRRNSSNEGTVPYPNNLSPVAITRNTYTETDDAHSNTSSLFPTKVRIIGHSTGGAIAAIAGMILEGGVINENSFDQNEVNGSNLLSDSDIHSIVGLLGKFPSKVQVVALGPPPCIGRSTVARYITTFICGDDVVPRAHHMAVKTLHRRVLSALEAGAGRKKSLGYLMGTGLLADLSSVAGKSFSRYKGRKLKESPLQLSLPGRVFFIKPRKFKEGATIQRVLRGNWQEDMLWQLHDVLISKRMLEHHSLDSYIRTLNRC